MGYPQVRSSEEFGATTELQLAAPRFYNPLQLWLARRRLEKGQRGFGGPNSLSGIMLLFDTSFTHRNNAGQSTPPYMGRLKSSANSWCFIFFRASRTGDGVVIGRRRSTPTSQAAAADHLT
jgi:hypothetical protein